MEGLTFSFNSSAGSYVNGFMLNSWLARIAVPGSISLVYKPEQNGDNAQYRVIVA